MALTRLNTQLIRRLIQSSNSYRCISTSKKSQDTATVAAEEKCTTVANEKNWISYGFDYKNKEDDRNAVHSTFFFSVTCCLVIGGFVWAYMPDYALRDWAQREAFLEIRRREQAGLPHVDPNYIDIAKIQLPSDEELGDTEIII